MAGEFLIHDGDSVVFLGDSITEQKLYTTYIEAYALTRYPNWNLKFRNVGWGGDTAWLRQRSHTDENTLFAADEAAQQKMVNEAVGRGLARDVFPLKPTVVTVKFGMNDHAYQAFRPDIFAAYVRSETRIVEELKQRGARVALLTPQPIEEHRPDPDKDVRNQSLRKFGDGLKDIAAKESITYVDQFDPYMSIMMRERAANPSGFIGGGDAVHPGKPGHTLMAWAVLKGLGAVGAVSTAEIDIAAKKVASCEQCEIKNLSVNDDVVSFDRVDACLPMPIDQKAEPALKLAPVLDELSRYELKVSGLPAKNYELTIDGESAAKFTAEELAKGCNLSVQAGPITKQSRQVLDLIVKKNDLFFNRWRNVQVFELPFWARNPETEAGRNAEMTRLDHQIAELEGQIDQACKPKSHHFELKPVAS